MSTAAVLAFVSALAAVSLLGNAYQWLVWREFFKQISAARDEVGPRGALCLFFTAILEHARSDEARREFVGMKLQIVENGDRMKCEELRERSQSEETTS